MSLKPWREVAHPHKDVLEGTFKQSEFAADITQVHSGTATEEYQSAEKFFERTFITEGMRLLLMSVAERLSGQGGDPVIQLQTAFGGGKTHTLLAVYHLASRSVPTSKLAGIPPILDAAKVASLPQARVAVIDGNQLSPSQPRSHDGVKANTLWGELAVQLLGADGYALVENSDRDGTSPGKEVLAQLLTKAAPCVVLVDELVAYIRQFESGQRYAGGTFDSNLSFVQALTEAMKAVPNAILLATLPESEVEIGGVQGQRALATLEKYFGRVESVWKPVGAEESFEIVRRRLFDHTGDMQAIHATVKAFCELYRQNPTRFPADAQEARYEERIVQSYPIHPEVFDRLYEDWSTLDGFQRTRGVLQYMAIVIHRLWNDDDKNPLIMPGSLPLGDPIVRNKSIHYLPTGCGSRSSSAKLTARVLRPMTLTATTPALAACRQRAGWHEPSFWAVRHRPRRNPFVESVWKTFCWALYNLNRPSAPTRMCSNACGINCITCTARKTATGSIPGQICGARWKAARRIYTTRRKCCPCCVNGWAVPSQAAAFRAFMCLRFRRIFPMNTAAARGLWCSRPRPRIASRMKAWPLPRPPKFWRSGATARA